MSDDEITQATEQAADDARHALAVLQAAAVAPDATRRAEAVISDDCDHALTVLAAATVPPDAARREAVTTEAGQALKVLAAATVPGDAARRVLPEPKAPMFGLHHFALAAAVCFSVGLVALFKVSFTPPERIDVVAVSNTLAPPANIPALPAEDEANKPDPSSEPDVDAPDEGAMTGGGIGIGGGVGGGGKPATGGKEDGIEGTKAPPDDKPVKPDLPGGGSGGG